MAPEGQFARGAAVARRAKSLCRNDNSGLRSAVERRPCVEPEWSQAPRNAAGGVATARRLLDSNSGLPAALQSLSLTESAGPPRSGR